MMSIDGKNAVRQIYKAFLNDELFRQWSEVDDRLWELEFLNDAETVLEAEVAVYKIGLGTLKCSENHSENVCLVPIMLEAVNAILELYVETKELHIKNRYVLHNFLAAMYLKIIYVDEEQL